MEQKLVEIGVVPIERRLVRLWPFALRRTRGNASLSIIIDVSSVLKSICIDVIESWFNDLDIPAKIHRNNVGIVQLSFKKDSLEQLTKLLRPMVHLTMKKTLRQRISNFR